MKNTCVPGQITALKYANKQFAGIKHRKALWGFNALVAPCALALIMHTTRRDMGSLSESVAQGDPAVTVDYRVRDRASPQQHQTTYSPSPQLPWGKLWEQGYPRPALQAGGQRESGFILPVRVHQRTTDLFWLSVSLSYD